MKRIVLFAVILIFASSLCFADNEVKVYLYDNAAGSLPIYAHMDNYWVLSIDRIDHGGGTVGMDFDLLGDDVSYNQANESLGRLVAFWTFIVNLNVPWRLKVHASPLIPETPGTQNYSVVNYHLTFNLDYTDGQNLVSTDWKVYSSVDVGNYYYFPNANGSYASSEVSSIHKQIRFMLSNYTADEKYGWDEGRYISTVSLILESE